MSGVLLGSALEEAVKKLPKALKPEAVVPELKKLGVKDEELKLSGIGVLLPEVLAKQVKDAKGRVDLTGQINDTGVFDDFPYNGLSEFIETKRSDAFSTSLRGYGPGQEAPGFESYIFDSVKGNQRKLNYRERIYDFSAPNSVNDGSTHFTEPNYLMHTRGFDGLIANKDTHVVAEVQSDLHQKDKAAGRLEGNGSAEAIDEQLAWLNKSDKELRASYSDVIKDVPELADPKELLTVHLENTYTNLAEAIAPDISSKDAPYLREMVAELANDPKNARDTFVGLSRLPEKGKIVLGKVLAAQSEVRALRAEGQDISYEEAVRLVQKMSYEHDYQLKRRDVMRLTGAIMSGDRAYVAEQMLKVYGEKDAPWRDSWARKGLENELKEAIAAGKEQFAVPIKDAAPYGRIRTTASARQKIESSFAAEAAKAAQGKPANIDAVTKLAIEQFETQSPSFAASLGRALEVAWDLGEPLDFDDVMAQAAKDANIPVGRPMGPLMEEYGKGKFDLRYESALSQAGIRSRLGKDVVEDYDVKDINEFFADRVRRGELDKDIADLAAKKTISALRELKPVDYRDLIEEAAKEAGFEPAPRLHYTSRKQGDWTIDDMKQMEGVLEKRLTSSLLARDGDAELEAGLRPFVKLDISNDDFRRAVRDAITYAERVKERGDPMALAVARFMSNVNESASKLTRARLTENRAILGKYEYDRSGIETLAPELVEAAKQVLPKLHSNMSPKEEEALFDSLVKATPRNFDFYDGGDAADQVKSLFREYINSADPDEFDMQYMLAEVSKFLPSSGKGSDKVKQLVRSDGVQRWYESNVDGTVKKLGRILEADTPLVEHNGVLYRTIDLTKPGVKEKADSAFKLYAGGGAVAYYMALQQGVGEEDLHQYMLDQGFTEADIQFAQENQSKVAQALNEGIPKEAIDEYLRPEPQQTTNEPPPALPTDSKEKQETFGKLLSGELLPADELLAAAQVVKPNMSSVTTRTAAFFGRDESVKTAEAAELAMIKNIKELMSARGVIVDFQEGEWVIETPAGVEKVTPSWLQQIAAERGEVVGSIAGGIAGAIKGGAVAPPTPWSKAAGVFLGGTAGAIAGGVVGTELDYVYQSMRIQEEMSAEIAAHKALTASEAAALGEALGLGVYKFGGTIWRGAVRAKNYLLDGNTEGARKALRDVFFLSDDEVDEIVTRFEKLVDTKGMGTAQKEITAVASTLPGADVLVKAASAIDPVASRAVVKSATERANQLLTASKQGTTETARLLKQDLDSYVDDVKTFYGDVKQEAASNPRNKYYKFNLEGVAVKPVLESLAEKITDPAVREKFLLQMSSAQRYTDNRTFTDLIELRQLVNEFRFNKRISKAEDYQALDEVITNIDDKLEKGAKWLFGKDSDRWLKDFADARAMYAEMKTVQNNALYRLVNRPGITPEAVSNALLKYSDAIDGTYERVMSVLPKDMRRLAERDMISKLVDKYTVGQESGIRATQFPMLAKDLSTRSFVDEDSRQLVKAISDLSDTFRNDIRLSQSAGMIKIPEFQSYLTADPAVRAKLELASTIFNQIKQRIPGSKASREIALVKNAAKFLETPLNAKTVAQLKEEAKDFVSLDQQILAIQRQTGEALASEMDASGIKIKLYGNGKILKTQGTGAAMEIPAHRIASPEIARQAAITEGLSVDSKLLDDVLKRYGFKAVQYGSDKVRLLD